MWFDRNQWNFRRKPDFWLPLGHFLAWQTGSNSLYSMGESPPIKAGHQGIILHLGTTHEIHHIYEDLNESSSARPGKSQQLEIPPSLNSKQVTCFSGSAGFSMATGISTDAEISTPARILPSACVSLSSRGDFFIRLDFHICHDFAIRNDFWIRNVFNGRHLFYWAVFLYISFSAIILIIFHIFVRCVSTFRVMQLFWDFGFEISYCSNDYILYFMIIINVVLTL